MPGSQHKNKSMTNHNNMHPPESNHPTGLERSSLAEAQGMDFKLVIMNMLKDFKAYMNTCLNIYGENVYWNNENKSQHGNRIFQSNWFTKRKLILENSEIETKISEVSFANNLEDIKEIISDLEGKIGKIDSSIKENIFFLFAFSFTKFLEKEKKYIKWVVREVEKIWEEMGVKKEYDQIVLNVK